MVLLERGRSREFFTDFYEILKSASRDDERDDERADLEGNDDDDDGDVLQSEAFVGSVRRLKEGKGRRDDSFKFSNTTGVKSDRRGKNRRGKNRRGNRRDNSK